MAIKMKKGREGKGRAWNGQRKEQRVRVGLLGSTTMDGEEREGNMFKPHFQDSGLLLGTSKRSCKERVGAV